MAKKLMPVLTSLLLGSFSCGITSQGLSRYIPGESCDNPFTAVRDEIAVDSLQARIDRTANYSGRIFNGDVRKVSNGSLQGRKYLDITYRMDGAIRGPDQLEITVRHFLDRESNLERLLNIGERVIVFCNEVGTGLTAINIGTDGPDGSTCKYTQPVFDYLKKTAK